MCDGPSVMNFPKISNIFYELSLEKMQNHFKSHQSFYVQVTYEREDGVSLAALKPLEVIEGRDTPKK